MVFISYSVLSKTLFFSFLFFWAYHVHASYFIILPNLIPSGIPWFELGPFGFDGMCEINPPKI